MAKNKKKVKYKVKNIIILLLIFGFIVLVGYCFLMMPIDNIYINGNFIVSDNEIMEIVSIDDYPSFVLANRFEMKKLLLNNNYIKDVKIKKKFGNKLEFDVEEYKVIALKKDNKVLVSSSKVLDNVYNIYDIPLMLNDISDEEINDIFVTKMVGIDKDIFRQISEIEYSPVEVDKERFLFYMSDGNVIHVTLTKLGKVNKYNKIKDKLDGKRGVIYLDSGDYVELIK